MPHVEGDIHMEIWEAENYQSPAERSWYSWIQTVENLLGHSADGDNSDAAKAAGTADGYSLDELYDAFLSGKTPADAVSDIGEHAPPGSKEA
jgi:hypothetical protein